MTGDPPPAPASVASMRALDELVSINPRLKPLLMEAELDTEAQLQVLRQSAREKAAISFFFGDGRGDPLFEEVLELERAIRNYLKQHPPLTRRPRRGKI